MADQYIKVKSGLPNGKVALWEQDPRHPNGEVFVAADADNPDKNPEVEVGETPIVMQYIGSGRLVRVSGGSSAAKEAAKEAAPPEVQPVKK
jgi:hypothetical protein